MTLTYVDSSALVRLIAGEGNTRAVEEALRMGAFSSLLARLEVRAACYKRWHDREIGEAAREALLATAESVVFPQVTFVALGDEVFTAAHAIVESYSLRTLDTLHVATAVVAERRAARRGESIAFCTADRRQAQVAGAMFGLQGLVFVEPWRGGRADRP